MYVVGGENPQPHIVLLLEDRRIIMRDYITKCECYVHSLKEENP